MRVEVAYRAHIPDGRAARLLDRLRMSCTCDLRRLSIIDAYLINHETYSPQSLADLFLDPVAQQLSIDTPLLDEVGWPWNFAVEVLYRPGVTDPVGATAARALAYAGGSEARAPELRSAVLYVMQLPGGDHASLERIAGALHNPLIQQARTITREEWRAGRRFSAWYPAHVLESPDSVERYDLSRLSAEQLAELSRQRLLALTVEEMEAVKDYFSDPSVIEGRREKGLGGQVTDVELEMIAQTWSEHCKHKIFNAAITYCDESDPEAPQEVIQSLFSTYIRATTDALRETRPFLKSVFHDNSGVISFDENNLICFKVETHNSPSALDPYGGAITGIVGVNRDILGTGKCARPLWNTDVLCFGFPDTPEAEMPEGLLPPRQIMEGVHRGIIDGGNQSGIPVAAGAFLFDESFTGKPLVFCGTGGILPAWVGDEEGWQKQIEPGDFAVMVGGRIGKDGIHGATFSSLALDETSPTSAVQIGDPITQRKMTDFLLEARDLRLFRGITDNGAGGLSSSLGEMAETCGGVRVDLDACPTKYAGLAAWEIWVSESQERMSLAVQPECLDRLIELAEKRDVEATVIGQFTSSGHIDIDFHGKPVCRIGIEFLHRGLPQMRLKAVWPKAGTRTACEADGITGTPSAAPTCGTLQALVLAVLADPNIASKEELVRQYDHEVKGRSVIKPFAGVEADGPTDGAVIMPVFGSTRGITITHGICPRYGDYDTYDMALCAVDEAYRAHIILGGDPDHAAALDNFCWPDPVKSAETPDGELKLAQLVRACRGLKDACLAYGLPLVSGKDSMKNDARAGGRKISVRPTLLVSLFGVIQDARKALTTDFKRPGSLLYLAGETREELAGSALQRVLTRGTRGGADRTRATELADDIIVSTARYMGHPAFASVPTVKLAGALEMYRAVARAVDEGLLLSAHDLSDGGLAVAAAEAAIGGRLGAEIDLAAAVEAGWMPADPMVGLFSESPSRFLIEIDEKQTERFEQLMSGMPVRRFGRVSAAKELRIHFPEELVLPLDALSAAWKRTPGSVAGSARW